jgi:hypothetical protein
MLILVVIAREKQFKMATIEIFPGDDYLSLRPVLLAGIKACDVIMHKVYSR